MDSSYNVKTHIFEGPLDTLLSLIEKRKLFINDISLAQVADDYIAYVKSLQNSPLNTDEVGVERPAGAGIAISDLAHFILIASTLVLIKSKSLLPDLSLTEEEQDSIDDLEDRLKQYQKYKELSRHLRERFGIRTEYFKQPRKDKVIVFSPDKNTNVTRITELMKSILSNMSKTDTVPKAVVQKVVSLEEMIDSLTDRIQSSMKMSFKDFSKMGRVEKVNVIVSFLAMLELVKQGVISVRQDKDFHDIEMETNKVGVPTF